MKEYKVTWEQRGEGLNEYYDLEEKFEDFYKAVKYAEFLIEEGEYNEPVYHESIAIYCIPGNKEEGLEEWNIDYDTKTEEFKFYRIWKEKQHEITV